MIPISSDIEYLRNSGSNVKPPLFKLFRVENKGYFYDTGTNKLFACNAAEFELLNSFAKYGIGEALRQLESEFSPTVLNEAVHNLRSTIEKENLLLAGRDVEFAGAHFRDIEDQIMESMRMIQLEVTERCNLRCDYCLYGEHYGEKRNHGHRDMSPEIARKAIEHFKRHSQKRDNLGITFYGGEPLLRFQLLLECVQFAEELFKEKNIGFSITTNGTLITPVVARLFIKHGVHFVVSIDGPQEIHDGHRKDQLGRGSFEKALNGLKILLDVYGDARKVSISMVYTPPYSESRLDRMAEIWDKTCMPRNLNFRISYPVGYHPCIADENSRGDADFTLWDWAAKRYLSTYRKGEPTHPVVSSIVEGELIRFIKRTIYLRPTGKIFLNGCCVPAARKQFVTVDGKLILCERIGMAPEIGDLDSGIDIQRVKQAYVLEYSQKSKEKCSECWGRNRCSVCYIHAYRGGIYDLAYKTANCTLTLMSLLKTMELYCRLIEINSAGLDYLADAEIL